MSKIWNNKLFGAVELFGRDKPILSAETHTEHHKNEILDILQPLGYQFVEKIVFFLFKSRGSDIIMTGRLEVLGIFKFYMDREVGRV
jgi:hypothetical protein